MPGGPLFLHIGLQKTGTTYLQSIFWQNLPVLREQGLDMVPGSKRETWWLMLAVRDRYDEEVDPPAVAQALDRLPRQLAAAVAGRALVTEESLAAAGASQIRSLLEACAGREVHLVLTVRALARQIPSAWQQTVQSGGTEPFDGYLERLRAVEDNPDGLLWRNKAVSHVLERWREHVPPERIHVVTVPPSDDDPEVLLERFCGVVGVDPERLDRAGGRTNPSLRHVHAEVLRRVNERLEDRHLRRDVYGDIGKRYLAVKVLGDGGGERVRLPRALEPWCAEVSRRHVDHIARGGYDVVGDLAELLPSPSDFVDELQLPTEAEVADATTAALAAVLGDQMDRLRARRRGARRHRTAPATAASSAPPARASLPRRAVRRLRRLPRGD